MGKWSLKRNLSQKGESGALVSSVKTRLARLHACRYTGSRLRTVAEPTESALGHFLEAFSIPNADGSGQDIIFGDRWSEGTNHGGAFVDYPAGSPSRWAMVPASVPDSGTTLGFLILGLCAVVAAGRQ